MFALKFASSAAAFLLLLAPAAGLVAAAPPQHVHKTAAASASAGMSNADIIALADAGMTDQIIIAKIKAAPSTSFDTSVPGLKALKAANVSGTVIAVMINPTAPAPVMAPALAVTSAPPPPPPPANPNDPLASHAPGIYILAKGSDGQPHLTLLERTMPKEHKSGGIWASSMTYGIAKGHTKAVIDGAQAPVETTDAKPVFYLYVPDNSAANFGGSYYNPKDFVMVKLDVSKDTRTVNTGSYSMWGSSAGTDEKSRQGFTSDNIKPGVYKLTPVIDLPAGQYAFQQGNAFFYDFGVQPAT